MDNQEKRHQPKDTHSPISKYILVNMLLFAMCISSTTAHAQDKTAEIDKVFSWATNNSPGCACAVSKNGKLLVNKAYGLADVHRTVAITNTTVFDIASIQKQFVAAAVLMLEKEGRLSLSDDVRKHIPQLPIYGHKITIDHLLTHTSGLRDWTGILPLSEDKPDAMTLILRQEGLNFEPGEEWSYSNSGYVLLKEIIARKSGMTIDEFLRKRIFVPLGMKSSQYLSNLRDSVKDRALAYEKQGDGWKLDIKLDNDRGGGGAMLSNPHDLIIWNDALANNKLGKLITQKLQEAARLKNGRRIGYARGLYLDQDRNNRVIWHTGGSAGYGSVLVRFPDQDLSIAIACNSGDEGNRLLAVRRIFDLFAPDRDTTKRSPGSPDQNFSVAIDPEDLKAKEGLFFNERTNQPLRLGISNGRLRVVNGGPLVTIDKDRFRNPDSQLSFFSNDKFEIHFISKDQFELKTIEGKVTRYRRAKAFRPTANELQAFVGRYKSDEIGGYFELSVLSNALMGRVNEGAAPGFPLTPVDTDAFQLSNVMVRFLRDSAGKVIALEYSNPVVRKVQFKKILPK